jgi:GTP-binding protein
MANDIKHLRNIAIIAHVDHGKTTLVDKLLHQSGTFGDRANIAERAMDSGDIEQERGITILAKNTAIRWTDKTTDTEYRINIVDTPGHADFGGEVERALNCIAGLDADDIADDMTPLFKTIVDVVQPPQVDAEAPFRMQISSIDYNSFVGVIGIGRIQRGKVSTNTQVTVVDKDGKTRNGRILKIMGYHGLDRIEVEDAQAGDIICITGIDALNISDTICDPNNVEALPALTVDEPTVSMNFQVNNSPFAGREGKFVTSRNIRERLDRELIHNVALRVEDTESPDKFKVSGRGELHLSVLIENMRREGYELGVSGPEVIVKEVDGKLQEPYENVIFDIEEQHQGPIMEQVGLRKGEMTNMILDGKGRMRIEATMPARGLIGFRSEFLTLTSGTGILTSSFSHYGPQKIGDVGGRANGVLVSMAKGTCLGFALFNLQKRGKMFAEPQLEVYEGMIVGLNSRNDDMAVNPTTAKQLTNVRASGTDEALTLTPAIKFTLEQALEFIQDDELVEVTPKAIRLRKRYLTESERKRHGRKKGA